MNFHCQTLYQIKRLVKHKRNMANQTWGKRGFVVHTPSARACMLCRLWAITMKPQKNRLIHTQKRRKEVIIILNYFFGVSHTKTIPKSKADIIQTTANFSASRISCGFIFILNYLLCFARETITNHIIAKTIVIYVLRGIMRPTPNHCIINPLFIRSLCINRITLF